MQEKYYLNTLYPIQDNVLQIIGQLKLDFYLTGGTALGRCYLNHRYSDDFDFFVNDHNDFKSQSKTAINALKSKWECDIVTTSDDFIRLFLSQKTTTVKIDFVNDIPFHFGSL